MHRSRKSTKARRGGGQLTDHKTFEVASKLDRQTCYEAGSWIPIVMKSHAVELFKRVSNFPVRRGQSRIHRDTLHLRGSTGATDFHAGAFLDVAEVDGVSTTTLVGDHGRLHMTNKSPLCLAEERMGLDIRSSGSSAKTFCLVFDQQFTDYGLAEAKGTSVSLCTSLRREKRCNLLGDLLCSRMLRELNFIS